MREILQDKLKEFKVVPISKGNVQDVWELIRRNVYFYSKTQGHETTLEECMDNITALPRGRGMEHKTYVGIYKEEELVAVVDLIEGFPDEMTAYLGLLILNVKSQGNGIGKRILEAIIRTALEKRFEYIELACHEVNEKGFAFWSKSGFKVIRKSERVTDGRVYTLLSMRRRIA